MRFFLHFFTCTSLYSSEACQEDTCEQHLANTFTLVSALLTSGLHMRFFRFNVYALPPPLASNTQPTFTLVNVEVSFFFFTSGLHVRSAPPFFPHYELATCLAHKRGASCFPYKFM
jgi:hypothetical protein